MARTDSLPLLLDTVDSDELTQLELEIARRADDLMSRSRPEGGEHDYWREAEEEVWSRRLRRAS